jgi:hypothetical protein
MDIQRKEVVIENDLGWRINTLVDFAAGRMPSVTSTARDAATRRKMTAVIGAILAAGGGVMMLQELVLRGAVSGSAWVRMRPTGELLGKLQGARREEKPPEDGTVNLGGGNGSGTGDGAGDPGNTSQEAASMVGTEVLDVERWLRLEIADASRLCPLPEGGGYVAELTDDGRGNLKRELRTGLLERVRSWFGGGIAAGPEAGEFSFDLFGANHWQRYVRGVLTEEGENVLGIVPFVRYFNGRDLAAGTRGGPAGSGAVDVGVGEIEPLVGLQDELNTRLSDRAYRVTMTSFRMWLGRGIEDFTKRPVGPGQMWSTDNPSATIEAFGGDANAPSEAAHIEEVREALDKISGVPPVAAGVLREKLGNLTSAVALKVTLIALLSRTERKRAAMTETLGALVREVLGILDRAGIVASAVEDREIDVNWPTALPESDMDRLQEGQAKVALGVSREVVLAELGYGEVAAGKGV